jgi:catechol-2,3-dioxygenase
MEINNDLSSPGASFLSIEGYHHRLALNTWLSRAGTSHKDWESGLEQFAVHFTDKTSYKRLLPSARSTCPSRFAAHCVNNHVNKLTQCFTVKLIDCCSQTYGTIFYKNIYLLDKDINITNRL